MVGYMDPTLSLAEAYHAAQTWLIHAGAVPERVDEPVDGVIEMEGGGLFSRIRYDRLKIGQAAILALLKHVADTDLSPVLFSVSGYSDSAQAFADNHAVALYTIDSTGDVIPHTSAARLLMPKEEFIPPFSAAGEDHYVVIMEDDTDAPELEEVVEEVAVDRGSWKDCPNCGTSHHTDASFCVTCGADLTKRVVQLKPRPSPPSRSQEGTPVPESPTGRPTLRCRTCGSHDIELLNNP
jgi:hypothetical protein